MQVFGYRQFCLRLRHSVTIASLYVRYLYMALSPHCKPYATNSIQILLPKSKLVCISMLFVRISMSLVANLNSLPTDTNTYKCKLRLPQNFAKISYAVVMTSVSNVTVCFMCVNGARQRRAFNIDRCAPPSPAFEI